MFPSPLSLKMTREKSLRVVKTSPPESSTMNSGQTTPTCTSGIADGKVILCLDGEVPPRRKGGRPRPRPKDREEIEFSVRSHR